jgi:hypothetical protein
MSAQARRPSDRSAEVSEREEVRRLLHVWPSVLRLATDPWAQSFAASIWRKAGDDPRWMPTHRQRSIMRAMVRQISAQSDDEVVLIEE